MKRFAFLLTKRLRRKLLFLVDQAVGNTSILMSPFKKSVLFTLKTSAFYSLASLQIIL